MARFIFVLFILPQTLWARPLYKKVFDALYYVKDASDIRQQDLNELITTVRCGICHSGLTKKVRNIYGSEIEGSLSMSNETDTKKIRNSILDAEKGRKDSSSLTFGEILRSGHLPAGDTPTFLRFLDLL